MKFLIAVPLGFFAVALSPVVAAQSSHAAHHGAAAEAKSDAAMTDGVVRRVDKAAGSVTIAHEALTNLNMPKMTMTFAVKDRAWLGSLKEGTRIRFVAQNLNGALTVVALEQVK